MRGAASNGRPYRDSSCYLGPVVIWVQLLSGSSCYLGPVVIWVQLLSGPVPVSSSPTMMTSNRPLDDWGKLIGDVASATAILDRFLHRAEVVQITGKSYRLEKSEKIPKSTKAPTGSPAEE